MKNIYIIPKQKQVNIAIDALKCFLVDESISPLSKMMDVEYRFTETYPNSFIYDTNLNKFDFKPQIERVDGIPISLDNNRLKQLFESGLNEVSEFISNHPKNEFSKLILTTISSIGGYSSEKHLHKRIVKIISVYETLFIPLRKGKGKGQTIIKSKVLPQIIGEHQLPVVVKIFREFYDIRDKYLHNGLEKQIVIEDLYQLQKITVFLLRRLINLRNEITNTSELLKYFDIK